MSKVHFKEQLVKMNLVDTVYPKEVDRARKLLAYLANETKHAVLKDGTQVRPLLEALIRETPFEKTVIQNRFYNDKVNRYNELIVEIGAEHTKWAVWFCRMNKKWILVYAFVPRD